MALKPIIRKVWSPIGQRPQVLVHQRYEWSYLYAFVRAKTGEIHWLILPTVNVEVFSIALEKTSPGTWGQPPGGASFWFQVWTAAMSNIPVI